MSDLKILITDKIPMNDFALKGGGKGMRFQLKYFEDRKNKKWVVINYTLKTAWPEGYELSENFDKTLLESMKAMKDKRNDFIIFKGVKVGNSKGQLWMYPVSGCKIVTVDHKTFKPIFHKDVTGENKKVEQNPNDQVDNAEDANAGSPFRSNPEQAIEDGDQLEESMGKLPDGSGFMTAIVKESKSIVGKILKEAQDNFFSKNFIVKIGENYMMDSDGVMTNNKSKAYNFDRYEARDIKERLSKNNIKDYQIIWL